MELVNTILPFVVPVLVIIAVVIAYPWLKSNKANAETATLKWLAEMVVMATEQQMQGASGAQKLEKAIEDLTAAINAKGIKVSEATVRMLIEAAVGQMNFGVDDK